MEFGLFHEFQWAAGQGQAEAFAQSFEQVDAAESWGPDAIWIAEVHFSPHRSVLSAPLVVASAIAARTSRMMIGTAVQVLPLCHPLRLAEEVATVDQISRGRLIFGVGRGSIPTAYEARRVPYAESRGRFSETLDILKLAWTPPQFSYRGKHYAFDNITLVPRPHQSPYPPIRVAAAGPDTYSAAAELGYPIFITARLGALSELAPLVRTYRDAYKAAGHVGEGEVYLRVPVYVAANAEQARREPEESIMRILRHTGDRIESFAIPSDASADDQWMERARRLKITVSVVQFRTWFASVR